MRWSELNPNSIYLKSYMCMKGCIVIEFYWIFALGRCEKIINLFFNKCRCCGNINVQEENLTECDTVTKPKQWFYVFYLAFTSLNML